MSITAVILPSRRRRADFICFPLITQCAMAASNGSQLLNPGEREAAEGRDTPSGRQRCRDNAGDGAGWNGQLVG
jgi:hypothetical protein